MELLGDNIMMYIGTGGLFAPLLFISFHLLRPVLFIPVMFICIAGGLLFGPIAGTFYSIIGITLSSILFYFFIQLMPKTYERLIKLKTKLIGDNTPTSTSQIAILRLIPFIHFHLLSLCLIEITMNFREYIKSSILSNIPLAVIYTSLGQQMASLSPISVFTCLTILFILVLVLRKKEITIKWHEFFSTSTP